MILDWDVTQIEGAMLETWLPQVFARLEELARLCRARRGSIGAFIEDKNSGTILLQQALRRQMPARAIDSKLTAMGKDERAISVSGYVHRESVKYTDRAFEKTVIYKLHLWALRVGLNIPKQDVRMDFLEPTESVTRCRRSKNNGPTC